MEQKQRELIIRYFLGDLSEAEQCALEDQYFDADEYFEELLIIEEELIDSYVHRELSGRQRQQFEKSYLISPARRERVMFANTLMMSTPRFKKQAIAASPPSEGRSWLQMLRNLFASGNRFLLPALAAAFLIIVLGGAWLAIDNIRLRNQILRAETEREALERHDQQASNEAAEQRAANEQLRIENEGERSRNEQLNEELTKLQSSNVSRTNQSPDVSYELAFNLTRGSDQNQIFVIPRSAKLVELKLNFEENNYKSFLAEVRTRGVIVWREVFGKGRTMISRKSVIAQLPANLFTDGDYILTLSAAKPNGNFDAVAEYSFKVMRK